MYRREYTGLGRCFFAPQNCPIFYFQKADLFPAIARSGIDFPAERCLS